jgi:hypothetical protein|tara:strand:+ start:1177 stop:1860 length:684 start_codon:yes stop_codon:yes gene_type:complete
MRLYFFLALFLNCFSTLQSQVDYTIEQDSLYREDQFYLSVTYNALINLPNNVSQNSFSTGVHLGAIRDFPLNKRRNIALALGLGYSFNFFNQNIRISGSNPTTYTTIEDSNYSKNNFSQHFLEAPLEFRWRTSKADSYKFWRVYTGLKLGYLIASKSVFDDGSTLESQRNLKDLNRLQYGLTLSVGYNTWNGYIYYGLNPVFDHVSTTSLQPIEMSALKVGLIFYIL